MRFALLVNYFPPEIGSASDLFYELALELQRRGNIVDVFTTETRHYNLGLSPNEKTLHEARSTFRGALWRVEQQKPRLTVYRVKLLPLIYPRSGESSFLRELEHVLQPATFLSLIHQIASADVILVYSPPLVLGFLASIIGKVLNIPTIVNVQDIHPQAIVDLGLLRHSAVVRFFEAVESVMYKLATLVTVHSDGNREIVARHGISKKKVILVHNACRIPSLEDLHKNNSFREEHSVENRFVITYAGIMSFSQDLDTVVKAAKLLSNELKDAIFILAGDGPQRSALESLITKLNAQNILLLPFQPGIKYWRMLAASDICLVSLNNKVKTPVVPRKLADIMATAKPVLANVPLDGDVPKLVEKAKCGTAIEPENPHLLAQTIRKMHDLEADNRLRMGQNGRSYALKHFSVDTMACKYEAILPLHARFNL